MPILDLTPAFIEWVIGKQDRGSYEAGYPVLFQHYFQYWCPPGAGYSKLSEAEIGRRAGLIHAAIEQLSPILESEHLCGTQLRFVLFVGGNTSNGHAFRDGDEMVVWLPVETYSTECRARIFVAHEVFHGLHYALSPGFCFRDAASRIHLGRQLITEGVATYLTAHQLHLTDGEALWADYLTGEGIDSWFQQCRSREIAISSLCRDYFGSTWGTELFMANDPANIMRFRVGYFIGLEIVRKVVRSKNYSPRDVLSLPRPEFEALAMEQLGIH